MSAYELAQLNIAIMKEPLDSPLMADFVANLDRINALADNAPGFVWRLQEDGDATALRPFGEDTIINMSVWNDIASLNHYTYKTAHTEIMRRKNEWFTRMREASYVLWWVPKGHIPSMEEAADRLKLLQSKGPTPQAFSFKQQFPPPDTLASQPQPAFNDASSDECPAN